MSFQSKANCRILTGLGQVLGDTYSSHNISDDDVLIVGKMGLLVAGIDICSCEFVNGTYFIDFVFVTRSRMSEVRAITYFVSHTSVEREVSEIFFRPSLFDG